MKKNWKRLVASLLTLVLLLFPAQALTVDQAKELLQEHYVDPISDQVLAAETMDELLDALGDPYTAYYSPEEYATFWDSMSDQSMVGVGLVGSITEDGLLVQEIKKNSPAEAAGMLVDDLIIRVDGASTIGQDAERLTQQLQGEDGSQVELVYLRDGQEYTVTLTRETITLPATTGELIDGSIGYIQCTTWGGETLGHFQRLMDEMEGQATHWIVDLRGNLGGLTSAAADVAELFCGEGTVHILRYGDGSYECCTGDAPAVTDLPLTVLVDGSTASASEAFCAAVRDHGRALLVGEPTYGKGVAQGVWDQDVLPEYFPDGDAFKLTHARFYSPLGTTNDAVGVLPHLLVPSEYALDAACLLAAHPEEDIPLSDLAQELGLPPAPSPFSDVADSPYAASINALQTYRLIEGNEQGQFLPQKPLTRAELCQMLYRLFQYPAYTAGDTFTDVAADAWYADGVYAIAQRGLVLGDGQGRFHPEDPLDHQQLFTILGRLAAWLNCDLGDQAAEMPEEDLSLKALQSYADWAKTPVWLLSGVEDGDSLDNLLWDEPERIDPTAPATREETAQLLHAILYYLRVVP